MGAQFLSIHFFLSAQPFQLGTRRTAFKNRLFSIMIPPYILVWKTKHRAGMIPLHDDGREH